MNLTVEVECGFCGKPALVLMDTLAQEFFVPVHNLADREVYEFWRALVV